jgi:hypothetical protein
MNAAGRKRLAAMSMMVLGCDHARAARQRASGSSAWHNVLSAGTEGMVDADAALRAAFRS